VRSSIADARPTAPRSRAPVPAATVQTPRSVLVRARRPATLADGPHSRVADRRSGSGTASRGTYTATWPESARAIARTALTVTARDRAGSPVRARSQCPGRCPSRHRRATCRLLGSWSREHPWPPYRRLLQRQLPAEDASFPIAGFREAAHGEAQPPPLPVRPMRPPIGPWQGSDLSVRLPSRGGALSGGRAPCLKIPKPGAEVRASPR
jgi:hypothetical protein